MTLLTTWCTPKLRRKERNVKYGTMVTGGRRSRRVPFQDMCAQIGSYEGACRVVTTHRDTGYHGCPSSFVTLTRSLDPSGMRFAVLHRAPDRIDRTETVPVQNPKPHLTPSCSACPPTTVTLDQGHHAASTIPKWGTARRRVNHSCCLYGTINKHTHVVAMVGIVYM